MTKIYKQNWESFEAITIEGERLRLTFIPEIGGKCVSFYDKQHEYEWLVGPRQKLRAPIFGDRFSNYDLSGWDEVLPSVAPCLYPLGDEQIPDHGEVWTLAWEQEEIAPDVLRLTVQSKLLPYRFSREIILTSTTNISFEYELVNDGDVPLAYIWSAHPLFRASAGTRLECHPPVGKVMIANIVGDELKASNELVDYPVTITEYGSPCYLNRVNQRMLKTSRKLYADADVRVQGVTISHTNPQTALRMSWSDSIQYFGLWIDEKTHSIDYVIAPEPCTGYGSSLLETFKSQQVAILAPRDATRWAIDMKITD